MENRKTHIVFSLLLVLLSISGFAQQQVISVHAENKSLNTVFEEISATYHTPFAFDADYFSTITVTIHQDKISVTDFLTLLSDRYHLLFEKIENTYVLYENPAPLPPKKPEFITLKGQVIDQTTGEPLLFCTVAYGENLGTITNELGIFNEKIAKTDEVNIQISHLGYQRLDTTINTDPDNFHQIALVPFAIHIEAIEVHQQEKNVIEMGKQNGRMAFNPKQSENLPRIDDSDLVTSLSLIPGVNFLSGQSSGISIRGGSPSENLILLDGMPILETSHLFGNLSVLNAKYISQAFVSRGAFDASFGERISGVVELTGKDNYYRPSLDLSANLLNVNASGRLPIGQVVSISGAYRKSYIDQWENYLYRQILEQGTQTDDQASVSPTVMYDDANLKLSIKPSANQEISLNAFQSNDQQNRDFIFSDNSRFFKADEANSENRGIGGNWRYQAGNWQHHFNLGYNELNRYSASASGLEPNKNGKGGKEESDTDENRLQEIMVSWSSEWKTGELTHQFGIGANVDEVSYSYINNKTVGNVKIDSINYDSEVTILHAFIQEKIQLTEKLHARIGVRVNQENIQNQLYFQPRWGISYAISEKLNLFYSGGIYNQFMSRIRKIDTDGNSDLVWFLPDSTGVGILESQQHVMGLRYESNGLSINIEPYYKTTSGKVNLYAELSGGKEKTIRYSTRNGKSEHYGFDVLVHYKQGLFTHMVAYSLSKSTEQFEVFNSGESYPAFDDQRHRIRWTEMARYKSWILSTNLTYHSGSPYLITQSEEAGISQEFGRLPFFAQADLSLMKRFKSKFFTISSGISLLNILNRKNVLEVDYFNISDNTGSYSIRTDITALKFTPVFFINIKLQ